ncbi:hypothetical protein DSO57_1033575 [Entomophthora muscae]|uniref:Uncharacterized protein n=1 Tax=Entomophthora muscae TaxID=34485 RepID=A0ACC2TMH0_9FUNG|nr:hypothetical protein DSO57_1033575 [Entomophthora muscae]
MLLFLRPKQHFIPPSPISFTPSLLWRISFRPVPSAGRDLPHVSNATWVWGSQAPVHANGPRYVALISFANLTCRQSITTEQASLSWGDAEIHLT